MNDQRPKDQQLPDDLRYYAKYHMGAGQPLLFRAADEIERLRAHFQHIFDSYGAGYAAWDFMHIVCDALGVEIPPQTLGQSELERVQLERLRAALCMLYDKWENGEGCSDDGGVFLGNAFRLTQAEEDQVLALIPAERAADETER